MRRLVKKILLRIEYGRLRTRAYLAQMRGDSIFAADCLVRSWDIERRIDLMRIQP